MTALAVEAFAPAMATFKCGRDFAAWLGLVPRQMSSGGKERLGPISKAGQSDIRRLLIIGAPLMHVNMHCRAVDVAAELDGGKVDPRGVVARPAARAQTEDAGGHRAGQQDGAHDLGHADQTARLQGSDTGWRCMIGETQPSA